MSKFGWCSKDMTLLCPSQMRLENSPDGPEMQQRQCELAVRQALHATQERCRGLV